MHRPRTGIQRDVIAEDRRNVEVHKRMGKAQQLQLRAFYGAEDGIVSRAKALHHAFHQVFRQNQRLTVNLYQRVIKIRRQRDRAVRRQRPRGGGQDDQRSGR